MKFAFPLISSIAFLSCLATSMQAQWIRQYPLAKLEDVLDLDVHTDGYGFAAGNNDLLLRLDPGSETWELLPGFGAGWKFESVDYLEGSDGSVAAAGGQGLILTTDKGNTWNEIPGAPVGINTLKIISTTHIIAVADEGAFRWQNDVWTDLDVPAVVGIKGGFIMDDQRMWVFTFATDPAIYYTTDGGDTWNTNLDIEDIDVVRFYDPMIGIATDGRKVYNTINGGVNWVLISNNAIHNTSNDMTFGSSPNVLMAATLNADPAISTDGGVTWTQLNTGLINQRSYSIVAVSDVEFWMGNDLSSVIHSVDSGDSWIEKSGPERNLIQDVSFVTRSIGLAGGPGGMLLRTLDAGTHWEDISFGTRSHFAIHGLAVNDLWIGANQRILHSSDTGSTWTEAAVFLGGNINDVLAISADRVLAASTSGVIYLTTDGGITWDTVYNSGAQMRSIARIDEQRYIATGFNGVIVRSEDMGNTWQPLTPPEAGLQYEQAHFIDSEGWLVTSSFRQTMWHTEDAGDSWTPLALPIDRFWDGVYFISQDTGIVVGRSNAEGRAYITFTGGQSWTAGHITTYPLYGVTGFPNPNGTAWIFGYGSDIEVLPYCNTLPSISGFAGDLFPCENDTVAYSINSENVDDFTWFFPPGWQILGNPNNDTVTVKVGANSGNISVSGKNICASTNPLNFSAGPDLLPMLSPLNWDLEPCAGKLIMYFSSSIQVDTFQWLFPPDWQIIGDDDESSVLVLVGHQQGIISLRGSNECGAVELNILAAPFVIPDVNVLININVLSLTTSASAYQWYLDGEAIAGANNATYIATESGFYYAALEFSPGCITNSDTVQVIITGIADGPESNSIKVYPVPADEVLFLDGIDVPYNYQIREISGRLIKKGTGSDRWIGVGELIDGFYILEIFRDGQQYRIKFNVKT